MTVRDPSLRSGRQKGGFLECLDDLRQWYLDFAQKARCSTVQL